MISKNKFLIIASVGMIFLASADAYGQTVPDWIKNNAGWWAE